MIVIDLTGIEKIKTEQDINKERAVIEAIQYLQSTDWQVIAKYERKRSIPDEVQVKRKAALDILTTET
jgi:hypothetical protein